MGVKFHFNFVKRRKIYYAISGILILISFFSIVFFGIKTSIEFRGGSILEIKYSQEVPSSQEIRNSLAEIGIKDAIVQTTNQNTAIIRMKDINEKTHQKVLKKLGEGRKIEELRFESVGPVVGRELKKKTEYLILLSVISIIIYITFAFRRVMRPVKSWQYGVAGVLALFHDVFIPIGIFSILGKFYGVEITIPIITALLTVFGYSINDSVVVFDRIRENLIRRRYDNFEETVNESLNQTLSRSINTSLTTLLVLFAIFFFGGETLRYFALALILGISLGTYSSIFIASPLLVTWWARKNKT